MRYQGAEIPKTQQKNIGEVGMCIPALPNCPDSSILSSHMPVNCSTAPLTPVMRDTDHDEVPLEASFSLNSSSTTQPTQILAKCKYSCVLQDGIEARSAWICLEALRWAHPRPDLGKPCIFRALVLTRAVGCCLCCSRFLYAHHNCS